MVCVHVIHFKSIIIILLFSHRDTGTGQALILNNMDEEENGHHHGPNVVSVLESTHPSALSGPSPIELLAESYLSI